MRIGIIYLFMYFSILWEFITRSRKYTLKLLRPRVKFFKNNKINKIVRLSYKLIKGQGQF